MNISLDFLHQFFHRHDDIDVDHMIEMACDALQFGADIVANGGGNF